MSAYSNVEGVLILAASLGASSTTEALEVRSQSNGAAVLTWTGASAADANFKLQESFDKVTWFDVASGSQTINAASGAKKFPFAVVDLPWLRAVYTKNSETTGTYTLHYYFKGAR